MGRASARPNRIRHRVGDLVAPSAEVEQHNQQVGVVNATVAVDIALIRDRSARSVLDGHNLCTVIAGVWIYRKAGHDEIHRHVKHSSSESLGAEGGVVELRGFVATRVVLDRQVASIAPANSTGSCHIHIPCVVNCNGNRAALSQATAGGSHPELGSVRRSVFHCRERSVAFSCHIHIPHTVYCNTGSRAAPLAHRVSEGLGVRAKANVPLPAVSPSLAALVECGSEASARAEADASALQTGSRAAPLAHRVSEGLGVRAKQQVHSLP